MTNKFTPQNTSIHSEQILNTLQTLYTNTTGTPLRRIYTRAEILFLMWDIPIFSEGYVVKVASCEPNVTLNLVSHTTWLKQPFLVRVHTDSSALWRFCTGYRTWWEGPCRCSPRWGWECTRYSRSTVLALPPVTTERKKEKLNEWITSLTFIYWKVDLQMRDRTKNSFRCAGFV